MKQKPLWLPEKSPVGRQSLLERWRKTSITKNVELSFHCSQNDCVHKNLVFVCVCVCVCVWGGVNLRKFNRKAYKMGCVNLKTFSNTRIKTILNVNPLCWGYKVHMHAL